VTVTVQVLPPNRQRERTGPSGYDEQPSGPYFGRPSPLILSDTRPIPGTQGSRSPLGSYNTNNTRLGALPQLCRPHDDSLPRTYTLGDTRSHPHRPRWALRQLVPDSSNSHSRQLSISVFLALPNKAEDISKGSNRGRRWNNL
jgi:hypothetical protein